MTARTHAAMLIALGLGACRGPCAPAPETTMPTKKLSALPGLPAFDPPLMGRLRAGLRDLGPNHVPRTEHLEPDGGPRYVNRLVLQTSPYLLQHAHNPVNWFPWGEEAFAVARALDRPILLSVGYATCHWCHVMERESFEDEQIAAFINTHFVAIKVDREERPDVDSVYMTVVQMMTGRGGWPMTVVMTPDKVPFFGGTYFPARDGDRGSRVGFLTILERLSEAYKDDRAKVLASAQQVSASLARISRPAPAADLPGPQTLVDAARRLAGRYDATHGGFGAAPKFPRPPDYELLLRYHRRTRDPAALEMVTHSLTRMSEGGIYDHLAGGFARYSTDAHWLVPHFEKMLYDNAQLAALAVEAWQASADPRFAVLAKDVLDYVLEEMTSPEGGFYSATDADSEGEEGKFFVWSPAEIRAVLSPELAEVAIQYWGVTEAGNFEGKSILHRRTPPADIAAKLGITPADLEASVRSARQQLYAARAERIPPLLDDKILTEWNGQMISALARAGFALDEARYLEAAARAADFVSTALQSGERLARAHRRGQAKHPAVLEDYAAMIAANLDLFEARGEAHRLDEALRLQAVLDRHFADAEAGGYFATADDAEALLIRDKPDYDGAQPSGNAVSALNLLRLYELTQDPRHLARAEGVLRAFAAQLDGGAGAVPKLACALDWRLDTPKEIVLVTADGDDGAALKDVLRRTFLPNRVQVMGTEAELEALSRRIPWLEGKRVQQGRATVYVCEAQACKKPCTDPEALAAQLRGLVRLEAEPLR